MARDGVIQHGKWWVWRLYRDGVRSRGKASDRATAIAQRAAKLLELEREKLFGPQPKRETAGSFGEYADVFCTEAYGKVKSADRFKGIIETLKAQWTGQRLDTITTAMIEAFKAKRRAVRDDATVIKELQVIKRLFRMATATGRLQHDPALAVKKPKAPEGRKSWQPSDKFKALMGAVPDWLRPLALFCYATGARRGEALDLLWRDVDADAGTITFRDAKAGTRVHYFNKTARALLESQRVRVSPINGNVSVFPVSSTRTAYIVKMDRAWRDACLKVGLAVEREDGRIETRYRWHDIRHQAGSDLRRAGADLWTVQTFLGHKSPTMTQRYAEVQPDDARRGSEALDRMVPRVLAQNWPNAQAPTA